MVDKAEVRCQLPVCHVFVFFLSILLQPSLGTQTMRAISQPISKGSELLSAEAYWLDTQQNEVEWRQVAEPGDNGNSRDKDVMDVGSWQETSVNNVTWKARDADWLGLITCRQSALQEKYIRRRLPPSRGPLLSPASRTEAAMCPIKQLLFKSVWTCFKTFQVQTEFN